VAAKQLVKSLMCAADLHDSARVVAQSTITKTEKLFAAAMEARLDEFSFSFSELSLVNNRRF
jgi:hypothetical protein